MMNRLSVLLLIVLIFFGCSQSPQRSTPKEAAASAPPSLGIPMPTEEILSALGPENNVPVQRLLPNPLFVVTGKPKQFLTSPVSAGSEWMISDLIGQNFHFYHFNPGGMEWFVQSVGFPMRIPVPQETGAPQRWIFVARRATVIAFENPLDLMSALKINDPATLESMKRTEGTTEYYDLTPTDFHLPLRVAFGLLDEKTAVLVEGNAEDIKWVFSDTIPKNAVLERLKHTPVDSNELTVISSLEGVPLSPEALEKLLEQLGQTGQIPPSVLLLVRQHLRAVTLSLNVSATVEQPILSISVEGRNEESAEVIGQMLRELNMKTLPISEGFATTLQNAVSVEVHGTKVDIVLKNFETLIPAVVERLNKIQTVLLPLKLEQKRMEQLGGLMQASAKYYREHQKFPANILDAEGKPLLSWRVALLPSLGFDDLYKKFKLDEPWDSEANLAVLNSTDMTPLLYHPVSNDVPSPKTRIRFFDSAGTPFSKRELKFEELKAPETTLMFVVVTPEYAVEWTKPEPLEFDINKIEEILGAPIWGVTFTGQVRAMETVPNTDPKFDEWKRYVESMILVLPAQEQ
jgi:hypothetical protein